MRIKELFTVPNGKKVTEKVFGRVLISSICSILLCMACLAGTTWAWFAVSIENKGNVIQIGTPEVTVTVNGDSFTSGSSLSASEHRVEISRTVNWDDLHQKMEFFVILTIQSEGDTAIYQIAVSESSSVTIKTNGECKLSWEASWFAPASADEISDGVIAVATEDDTVPATEPTASPSTEAVTEPATEETTTPSTESYTEGTTPATVPSTEAATEPSAETTTTEATEAATEAATIPTTTGETTEPTPATEETTIPATDATITPTTEPTSIPTEATEPVSEPGGTTSPTGTADH